MKTFEVIIDLIKVFQMIKLSINIYMKDGNHSCGCLSSKIKAASTSVLKEENYEHCILKE